MKNLVAAFLLLGAIGPVHATLIDYGSYTADTDTGLNWLDVTTTLGMSYNEVSDELSDPTSSLYGYRYATGDEFNGLISNWLGLSSSLTFAGRNEFSDDLLDGLIFMLGDTHGEKRINQGLIDHDVKVCGDESPSASCGTHFTYGFVADNADLPEGSHWLSMIYDYREDAVNLDYSQVHYGNLADEEAKAFAGSFLVAPSFSEVASSAFVAVPEPGVFSLIAMGLAGLGVRRLKK